MRLDSQEINHQINFTLWHVIILAINKHLGRKKSKYFIFRLRAFSHNFIQSSSSLRGKYSIITVTTIQSSWKESWHNTSVTFSETHIPFFKLLKWEGRPTGIVPKIARKSTFRMKTKSNKNTFKVIHYSIYPEDVLTIAKFVEILNAFCDMLKCYLVIEWRRLRSRQRSGNS